MLVLSRERPPPTYHHLNECKCAQRQQVWTCLLCAHLHRSHYVTNSYIVMCQRWSITRESQRSLCAHHHYLKHAEDRFLCSSSSNFFLGRNASTIESAHSFQTVICLGDIFQAIRSERNTNTYRGAELGKLPRHYCRTTFGRLALELRTVIPGITMKMIKSFFQAYFSKKNWKLKPL